MKIRRTILGIIAVIALLSGCNTNSTALEEELIDDFDEEFAEEIFDEEIFNDVPVVSEKENEIFTSESDTIFETEKSAETITETDPEIFDNEPEKTNAGLMEFLSDKRLENKTVKWLSYYAPWDSDSMSFEKAAAELFAEKYGGEIDSRLTTWNTRYNDLSVMILGGEGIDLFPDIDTIPYRAGIFDQSYDDYVDWESPVWSSVKALNDPYMIGEDHYLIACQANEDYVVFYNKKTISENGYDDPWELYRNNEWTMSKFTSMLEEFVDGKNERYGLDGWYNSFALSLVGGLAPVSMEKGKLVNNLANSDFERAMNYQYELSQKGLVLDKSLFNYTPQPQFIGEGKELFYIGGIWELCNVPDLWEYIFGDIDNVGIAPIPRDDRADKYYHEAALDCYNLCRGAENPEGAIKLMECLIVSYSDESTKADVDDFYRTEYGWTNEMIWQRDEIRRLVRENPVADISNGLPSDIYSIVIEMTDMPLDGTDWEYAKKWGNDAAEILIKETNDELEAMQTVNRE